MYYGYCFISINGLCTPKVKLATIEEVLTYCKLQSTMFPEIRVTDEDDFCILHVVNRVMYVPLAGGKFSGLNLETNEFSVVESIPLS